jgi:hypothetical protein
MLTELTRICTFSIAPGANKRGIQNDSPAMASYLNRPCPRCKGYLGIVLRESERNMPVRAVNGHCLKCGRGAARAETAALDRE